MSDRMTKQYKEADYFCHIFERWQEIIDAVKSVITDENEFDVYFRTLKIQTVGAMEEESTTMTVIIPEGTDSKLYDEKYKSILIQTIFITIGLQCEDIYFVTQSEMDRFYQLNE